MTLTNERVEMRTTPAKFQRSFRTTSQLANIDVVTGEVENWLVIEETVPLGPRQQPQAVASTGNVCKALNHFGS